MSRSADTDRLANAVKGLSRQERFDFRLSRRLPKMSGRANRFGFQLTGGRVGAVHRGMPVGLLTMTGRRSGKARSVTLMYLDDDARYLVVASNSGLDKPPAWYLNLKANPAAEFRTRGGAVKVAARDLDDEERASIWPRLVQHNPLYGAFQASTDRTNTVVALERD